MTTTSTRCRWGSLGGWDHSARALAAERGAGEAASCCSTLIAQWLEWGWIVVHGMACGHAAPMLQGTRRRPATGIIRLGHATAGPAGGARPLLRHQPSSVLRPAAHHHRLAGCEGCGGAATGQRVACCSSACTCLGVAEEWVGGQEAGSCGEQLLANRCTPCVAGGKPPGLKGPGRSAAQRKGQGSGAPAGAGAGVAGSAAAASKAAAHGGPGAARGSSSGQEGQIKAHREEGEDSSEGSEGDGPEPANGPAHVRPAIQLRRQYTDQGDSMAVALPSSSGGPFHCLLGRQG